MEKPDLFSLSSVERALERLGRGLVESIRASIQETGESFRKEPVDGPAREEHLLRKCLRENERRFGKDNFYCLGSLMRLAEFYRARYDGIQCLECYDRAVASLEPELDERAGPELDRVVSAGLGPDFPDAAAVFERRADFLVLYAQPERAAADLRRALELVELPHRRVTVLSSLAELAEPEEALACRREIWELSLTTHPPTDPELAAPARSLAAQLERCGHPEEAARHYALALFLDLSPRTARHYPELGSLYLQLGQLEIARDLREQGDIWRLEESTRGAPCTPLLRRDLERLLEMYERRGDQGMTVRTRHRLATVRDRLEARQRH